METSLSPSHIVLPAVSSTLLCPALPFLCKGSLECVFFWSVLCIPQVVSHRDAVIPSPSFSLACVSQTIRSLLMLTCYNRGRQSVKQRIMFRDLAYLYEEVSAQLLVPSCCQSSLMAALGYCYLLECDFHIGSPTTRTQAVVIDECVVPMMKLEVGIP